MSPEAHHHFAETSTPKALLVFNIVATLLYFGLITFYFPVGNPVLFGFLIFGEVFHVWQLISFTLTIWDTEKIPALTGTITEPVDVFITVAGEPVEIVRETARAALAMRYPKSSVYILNDGYVAQKENWRDMEYLAEELGVRCITRTVPGGAKAGNINHALRVTHSPFVVIFDADHVPHADFLEKTMGYFVNQAVGFVQSPQYYQNSEASYVAGGAWEQQELFFGPIMKGKNAWGSAFMCGTNMVLRRTMLEQVNGMCESNIAEDFLTSLFVHERGWRSVYVPEVLAEGLAPEDFLSYSKQQFRWARGSLEVIFKFNPLRSKRLTWRQKFQYLASASYYFSGVIILVDALLPLIFFFTGFAPLATSTMALAAVFLPYIFLTLYNLQVASNFTYTFRSLGFSAGSFMIHLKAIWAVLTNQKTSFAVTSKTQLRGNFLYLTLPHLAYIGLAALGIPYAIWRHGEIDASIVTNTAWALLNCAMFAPFILAAVPQQVSRKQRQALPATRPVTS
jgi:cellulose synthase (UDP-forming)